MMMIMFLLNLLTPVILGQFGPKIKMYSVFNKIWYSYETNYTVYDDNNGFAKFIDTCHFWANLVPK